ncbi:MAG: hypothetical protein HKN67_04370 [Saprospiraceae bacterium]|nr:hypothetical protein [Saprospiraceae bacterium]
MVRYKGITLSSNDSVPSPRTEPYQLSDPLASFFDLNVYGQRNVLFFNKAFIDDNGNDTQHYTFRLNNHFQGVVRHMDGQHFIFSGSNTFDDTACLFVFKLNSYLANAANDEFRQKFIRSNTIIPNDDEHMDNVEFIYNFPGPYWHAGGISLLGDILVCPLENKDLHKRSKICFINFRNPSRPKLYKTEIYRDYAAGCASMTKLKNKHFLLAVWTEDNVHKLNFYLSNSKNLSNGFSSEITVPFEDFKNRHDNIKPRFQCIQMIQNNDGSKIYIIGTDKGRVPKHDGSYSFPNRRFIMYIDLDHATKRTNDPILITPEVTIFPHWEIPNGGESYNFNAVGGYYVHDNQLYMYGGSTFRVQSKSNIRITEFAPSLKPTPKCDLLEDAIVELYTENEFKGRCLVLQIDRVRSIPDFRKIKGVKKKHFDDCIKSVRFKIPQGVIYRLFEDRYYNEGDDTRNFLDLQGSGRLEQIPKLSDRNSPGLKLKKSFRNKISSAQLVI